MFFPTPTHYSSNPSIDDSAADPFQWAKFDGLFDQVFGLSKTSSAAEPRPSFMAQGRPRDLPSTVPGGFVRGRAIAQGSDTSSDFGDEEEDFDKMWNDALRKTKKTTTTTTKRRIIRHTPEMDMPIPSAITRPSFPHPDDHAHSQASASYIPDSMPAPSTPRHRIGALDANYSSPESSPDSSSTSSSASYSPRIRRQNSNFNFHETADSRLVTATFEMPEGLSKSDVHVSYSTSYGAERVTVSWQNVAIEESVENGKLVRERKERKYARTLPLPKGTQFSQVKASLQDGVLSVTYPRLPLELTEQIIPLRLE